MVQSFVLHAHRMFASPLNFRLSACLSLGLLIALAACDSGQHSALPAAGSSTVRIVSSLPVRGVNGEQARQIRQAIDLAISQRSGHAGSWKVEHVALDDGDAETGDWTASQERENATQAANDPSVIALIGPYNSAALAIALPIANRGNLLEVSPSATWPGLNSEGWNPGEPSIYYPVSPRNFARVVPPDSAAGLAAAEWAHDDGNKSALVLDDGSSYSKGLGAAFTSRAQTLGIAPTGPITIVPGSTDVSALVREHKPAAIFFAPSSAGNAARLATALAGGSPDVAVYATDTALSDQFIEQAGQAAKGWRILHNSGTVQGESAVWPPFANAFTSRYGKRPSAFAAAAYDSTNLVLDAIAKFGSDRRKVLSAVLGTSGYQGASGEISFTESGDNADWTLTGWRNSDGRFERVRTISGGR